MFVASTSQFNEACLRRLAKQGPQDRPELRRGDFRHTIMATHLWLRGAVVEALAHATKMAPEQAAEFDGEAEEMIYGITQALDRLGELPDPEDVVAVEMLIPANIPEWARAEVRGQPGIRVSLTDEYALETGGLDFAYREWGPRGDCTLVIVNWKGKPADYERQSVAEMVIAWMLGWARGCSKIRHECRGLVFPWVDRHQVELNEDGCMPDIVSELLGWMREIEAAKLSENPPATVNEFCYSCSFAERCDAAVLPVVDPDAAVYMGGPIEDASTETIVAAMESLEPKVKLATDLLEKLEAEVERRIEAGIEKGWEIKRTPHKYGAKDEEEYRKIGAWLKMKKDEVEKFERRSLNFGDYEKALKARAAMIGKADELKARIEAARGAPTAWRKEFRRIAPALPPAGEVSDV